MAIAASYQSGIGWRGQLLTFSMRETGARRAGRTRLDDEDDLQAFASATLW
ncbi:hypothetical protein [Undibacter mobilis]|uniref:hypothetical protein n=1 Tax=Undibacter mobilis TaxID=2292256 RepID=UPI00143DF74B|nr:hypothetical protein [Undibacter mobilis]